MSLGVGHRRSSDPMLLGSWGGSEAKAPISPPSRETPILSGTTPKKKKKKKKKDFFISMSYSSGQVFSLVLTLPLIYMLQVNKRGAINIFISPLTKL